MNEQAAPGFILSAFADEIDPALETQIAVLKTHDIRHIEMRGVDGKNISELTLEEARAIRRRLDSAGCRVSAAGSPIGKIKITDPFEPHLDQLKHVMDIAAVLGTRFIRVFSFFIPRGEAPAHHRDEVLRRMAAMCREAQTREMILAHENEKGIYGDTPERCLDLLESIGSPALRAVFDPANFAQCRVTTWPEAFRRLKPHLLYLHIKDAVMATGSVVPAGQGDGHVPEILRELRDSGFSGFLSIEPHLGRFKGFEALEPGNPGYDLPEGGARQFAVAVRALKGILDMA